MNPAIDEAKRLLALAVDDAIAFRGMLSVPEIKFRLACFHAQQSVEKSLKARASLKIQSSDGTTSHSTRPPKNGGQVAGYKQDKARAKNCDAAYIGYVRSNFL